MYISQAVEIGQRGVDRLGICFKFSGKSGPRLSEVLSIINMMEKSKMYGKTELKNVKSVYAVRQFIQIIKSLFFETTEPIRMNLHTHEQNT